MHQPELYSRASDIQRHDAKKIVKEYVKSLQLDSNGKQSLLDVGSGSGDVLVEILAPALAQGFTRITGVDISPKMVEYSSKTYDHLPGVDFTVLDIETTQLPLEFRDQFDRVTSFYTLHWIRDLRQSLENIFNSLRMNGDCLLMFPGSKSTYDAYRILAKHPRWKNLRDVTKIFTPSLDRPQIGEEFERLMEQVGFTDRKVEVKKLTFVYEGLARFKDNIKPVFPFDMSDSEFEKYFVAFCDCFNVMGLREQIPGTDDFRFFFNYTLVVAHARKGK